MTGELGSGLIGGDFFAVITDTEGTTMGTSQRAAEWLAAQGLLTRESTEGDELAELGARWKSNELACSALDKLVLEQDELRECDFCSALPTHWRINLRHPVELAFLQATVRRAMYVCDACAGFIRANEKGPRHAEYVLDQMIEKVARERGIVVDRAMGAQIFLAAIRENIKRMYSARKGPPESMVTTDG